MREDKVNNMRKLRLLLISTLVIVMLMTSVTVSFGASNKKTIKMTAYTDVIVSGSYAYCTVEGRIYKVDLKNGSAKCIRKEYPEYAPNAMIIHKGYIYYSTYGAISGLLCRVKTNGKAYKCLAGTWGDYAIKNNKIYYRGVKVIRGGDDYKEVNKQMSLNGKNIKKSSVRARTVRKKTNKKGYKIKTVKGDVIIDYEDPYFDEYTGEMSYSYSQKITYYLVTPMGEQIKLYAYTEEW